MIIINNDRSFSVIINHDLNQPSSIFIHNHQAPVIVESSWLIIIIILHHNQLITTTNQSLSPIIIYNDHAWWWIIIYNNNQQDHQWLSPLLISMINNKSSQLISMIHDHKPSFIKIFNQSSAIMSINQFSPLSHLITNQDHQSSTSLYDI